MEHSIDFKKRLRVKQNCVHNSGLTLAANTLVKWKTKLFGTFLKCDGILENPKADQNALFGKYVIFEPNLSAIFVAHGYIG